MVAGGARLRSGSRLVRQIRAAVTGGGIMCLGCGGGAYPRQLTPLGFQDEPQTLWEAPRVYRDFGTVAGAPPILPLIPTNWGFAATGHSRFVIKSIL